MTDENDPTEAEIRKLGAQLRMGFYEFVNSVWRVVEEELEDFPEARERVRLRLDYIRSRRSKR
jgi:hypothetical protein